MANLWADATCFLDFDGVICDSVEECYQSSYLTLIQHRVEAAVPPTGPANDEYRAAFRQARPFIRSGEDYVVLHRLIQSGRPPQNQGEFDAELARVGRASLDQIKEGLYQVREALLVHHRSRWLDWNPLYPGLADLLSRLAASERIFILSTKKAAFIREILLSNGVDWPLERTIYTGNRPKLAIIEAQVPGQPAILVDDQIDHLDFAHPTCQCYLALWGYVTMSQVTADTPALSLEDFIRALRSDGVEVE